MQNRISLWPDVPDRQIQLVTGHIPMMRDTWQDQTSSILITASVILIGSVILLILIWLCNLLSAAHCLT